MIKTLSDALRCSSSPNYYKCDCSTCPWQTIEEVTFTEIPEAIESNAKLKNGKLYWQSCDCDRICQEAADIIDDLQKQIGKLME